MVSLKEEPYLLRGFALPEEQAWTPGKDLLGITDGCQCDTERPLGDKKPSQVVFSPCSLVSPRADSSRQPVSQSREGEAGP